jgi:hypothetical protein
MRHQNTLQLSLSHSRKGLEIQVNGISVRSGHLIIWRLFGALSPSSLLSELVSDKAAAWGLGRPALRFLFVSPFVPADLTSGCLGGIVGEGPGE